ncbi:hypothetical protein [Dryocola sp. BD586]|uniref:HofO family protein n=1 Tax=Dryocola sp. BD586 TaxID=3133271 RepID=UPI003F4F7772
MLTERWLAAPRRVKYASLAAVNAAVVILLLCFVIRPQQARLRESLLHNQQESTTLARLRHGVVALVSSTRVAEQPGEAPPPESFSAVEFAHQGGGKLEKWQPEGQTATLEMLLAWEKLPSLFARLSGYGDIALQGFAVEPKGERLRLAITLDISDEP